MPHFVLPALCVQTFCNDACACPFDSPTTAYGTSSASTARGHLNERGNPYSAASISSMLRTTIALVLNRFSAGAIITQRLASSRHMAN